MLLTCTKAGPVPAETPRPPENRLHAGIGLHTPASVHHGTAHQIRALRQQTLDAAYAAHPHRFSHRRPRPPKLPTEAWINQPSREALIQNA